MMQATHLRNRRVTLTPTGVLAGTPTLAGMFAFTIRATDATLAFGERAYNLTVIAAVPTLPQAFAVLLGSGLAAVGYFRLRRRAGSK